MTPRETRKAAADRLATFPGLLWFWSELTDRQKEEACRLFNDISDMNSYVYSCTIQGSIMSRHILTAEERIAWGKPDKQEMT